ncbi:hypothetical protein WMF45_12415 [Sorangium sp. So ce448]|uniref:hypothetical protein n=1 Tax=Sorangium sp. So ce448 TaxID=3133314 RepID=UPI003F623B19
MSPSAGAMQPIVRRFLREVAIGYGLFSTRDPEEWKLYFEDLGKLCAEAWHDDLPEEDRAWAAARRERFGKWVEGPRPNGTGPQETASALPSGHSAVPERFTPPWPMLLDAVEAAFLSFLDGFEAAPAGESEDAAAEAMSRLHRTYLWQAFSSGDTAQKHGRVALRAFQKGFALGRRGRSGSMQRPIPPMLEPPWYWGAGLPEYPGPTAARERAIRALPDAKDRNEWASRKQELLEIYASAWREDVPDEDREWAQAYRDCCTGHVNRRRLEAIARSAYESYLQSSGGVFDGAPGRTWPNHTDRELEPWRAFAERVDDAPEGESELEMAEAAAREYWDTLYRDAPPWDSDPDRAHWLAAARAARAKALAGYELPKRRWLR